MSVTDIDIRTATGADIPALTRARRLMFEELDDFDTPLLDRIDAQFEEYLGETMPAGTTSGWLAVDPGTGEWVGAVAIDWIRQPTNPKVHRPTRALLFGLYVRPEYRRRGVARALVDAAIDEARRVGAGAVQLHASEFGRPLYESLGFRMTSEMRLILDDEVATGS